MSEKRPDEVFFEGLMGPQSEKVAETQPAPPEKKTVEPQSKPVTSKNLFSHPEAHPLVLDLGLFKTFGVEWLSWLPETLFSEIEQTCKTSVAEVNKLKILAAKTTHVCDAFWEEWEIFEKTVLALNGIIPNVTVMQPPDLPTLLTGVTIANSLREETFNEEVSRYCAAIFLHENVHYAPEPMAFCQSYVTQPVYHCQDCDKQGSALPPFDGLCSSCAEHYAHDRPFAFKPNEEALKRGAGRNLMLAKTYDPAPIEVRFKELDALSSEDLPKNIREVSDDVQAAKLIIATDFVRYRSRQLVEQLSSLKSWLEMA